MEINVEIKDKEVQGLLKRVAAKIGDMTPAMRKIAGIMADSVEENFAVGGRPRWKPSHRAEAERGQTLVRSAGGLASSMVQKYTATEAIVGTNKEYATTMHFGAKKHSFGTFTAKAHTRIISQAFGKQLKFPVAVSVKAHGIKLPWGDIPARPFMQIHDQDWPEITAALREYLEG